MFGSRVLMTFVLLAGVATAFCLGGPDPRTASGQLAACGGAASWKGVGYLEFEVRVKTTADLGSTSSYRWDRTHGYLRAAMPSATGTKLDAAIDVGSKSGGAWEDGAQLSGKKLGKAVNWALQRFTEDLMWLVFPLDWGALGVTVKPLPDVAGEGGVASPAVEVRSGAGTWRVTLDPATGRIRRTVLTRDGTAMTVTWDDWRAHGGVFFAHKRTVAETGETVEVEVIQALPEAPANVF
ncbi:MAG: hypothetical protein LAO05_16350 [Acidobacteriia bacterium]|nr:hypothetical protein [Terriglobia bacterium]